MQTRFLLAIAMLFLLQACNINSNLMFKTDKNYVFDTPPETPEEKYHISKNDLLEFKLFSNGAFKVLDYASGDAMTGTNFNRFNLSYYVESDGTVRLPIVGKIYVKDSTIRQAEFLLEQLYSQYYVDPFVQLQVTNKRVIVFPGNGSDAKVVPLVNNNTTLVEALATAGGITDRGKARRVKVFRRDGNKRKAYLIDLSTIDGLKYADMIVQANDYIYVEPVPQYGKEVVAQIAPYISLLTSAILVYTVFQRVQ
ncbi:MAG TPA: polysaccharide biosynthesis/export family protein [Flavobacteriales bacterium]|nr:polysaccharide biosynthesis/export family protein [Flavobacteriales bacterium]